MEIYGRDRQAAHRGSRRQLRHREADVVPDDARDGPAGHDRVGVPDGRRLVGRGAARSFSRTIAAKRPPSRGLARRARGTRSGGDDLRASPAMIITRSPLRISLGGGGTDLPSYYADHGGFLVSAAIDKYVYVTIHRPFVPGMYPEVLADRARASQSTRSSTRSSARHSRCWASRTPQHRDHDAGRHPGGHGTGLVGQLHDGAVEGPVHASSAGCCYPAIWRELACEIEIDRLGGAGRQAGSVHRGLRRHHVLRVSTRPATCAPSRCVLSQTTLHKLEDTCCCSSRASRAARAKS